MMRLRTALVGVAGGMVLLLSACGNGPPPDPSASSSGPGGSSAAGGALQTVTGQTAAKKVEETDGLKFSPDTASVKVGDVVEWDNTGSTGHNVTFDSGTASDTMNGGDKYQAKFTAAGSYHFKCTFHAGMEGTITVA